MHSYLLFCMMYVCIVRILCPVFDSSHEAGKIGSKVLTLIQGAHDRNGPGLSIGTVVAHRYIGGS